MYAVIYRTGTPENCQWVRIPETFDRESVKDVVAQLKQEGIHVLIHKAKLLDSVGMPEGWE